MKKKRQEQIIEIIQNHEVETQEDLARYLTEAGYAVTQATVSRDIRELSLEKVPGLMTGLMEARLNRQLLPESFSVKRLQLLLFIFNGILLKAQLVTKSNMLRMKTISMSQMLQPKLALK